jgi:hypothetical protein
MMHLAKKYSPPSVEREDLAPRSQQPVTGHHAKQNECSTYESSGSVKTGLSIHFLNNTGQQNLTFFPVHELQ